MKDKKCQSCGAATKWVGNRRKCVRCRGVMEIRMDKSASAESVNAMGELFRQMHGGAQIKNKDAQQPMWKVVPPL